MAISPIMLARLMDNIRTTFQTAINMDIEITPESKFGEDEKKAAAESINAVSKGLVDIINLLVEIPPKKPAAAENAEASAEEPKAGEKAEEPAAEPAPSKKKSERKSKEEPAASE